MKEVAKSTLSVHGPPPRPPQSLKAGSVGLATVLASEVAGRRLGASRAEVPHVQVRAGVGNGEPQRGSWSRGRRVASISLVFEMIQLFKVDSASRISAYVWCTPYLGCMFNMPPSSSYHTLRKNMLKI